MFLPDKLFLVKKNFIIFYVKYLKTDWISRPTFTTSMDVVDVASPTSMLPFKLYVTGPTNSMLAVIFMYVDVAF